MKKILSFFYLKCKKYDIFFLFNGKQFDFGILGQDHKHIALHLQFLDQMIHRNL